MSGKFAITTRGVRSGEPPVSWRLDATAADPTLPLVLALHGWGMDEDLLARKLRGLAGRALRMLTPRAPFPIEGRAGASWYDYDGDQARFRAELLRTEALLLDLVRDVEREQNLTPRRRWLVGFSQGGYCGSWVALRNPDFFRGMAIVGARVKTEWLADEMRRAAAAGFETLLCHGRRDTTVPPESAERSRAGLEAAGMSVELRSFDTAHTFGTEQAGIIAQWLERASAMNRDGRGRPDRKDP